MDLSRLNRRRLALGGASSLLLVLSVLALPWFALTDVPQRTTDTADVWICGAGDHSCTAFETFPLLRWPLLAAALAPPILGWILARGHELAWPPGELTALVGFAAATLIAYNGILDRPGDTFGVGLDYGYWTALAAAGGIAATGFGRALESGPRGRKAPGTV